jgi:ADP-ribose pyrophosphatase YjhB (NUDIX family)
MLPEPDKTKATALRVGAAAYLPNAEGKILLQRRSDNGRWGLPGGSVEIGEAVAEAVVREVEEETGLAVQVVRLVGVYSDPAFQVVRYPDGNVVHYVSLFFECRIVGGTLRTCEESLELEFFDPADLPEDVLPMHRIRIADAAAGRMQAMVR